MFTFIIEVQNYLNDSAKVISLETFVVADKVPLLTKITIIPDNKGLKILKEFLQK